MAKNYNHYDLVLKVAKRAKELETTYRDENLKQKEKQLIKTINESPKKRNFTLEAHEELMSEVDNEC